MPPPNRGKKKKMPKKADASKAKAKAKAKSKEKTKSKSKSKSKAKEQKSAVEEDDPEDEAIGPVDFFLPPPPTGTSGGAAAKKAGAAVEREMVPVGTTVVRHARAVAAGEAFDCSPGGTKTKSKRQAVDLKKAKKKTEDLSKLLVKGKGKRDVEEVQDHYRVLGIHKIGWKATNQDIEAGYKAAVIMWHPDRNLQLKGDETMIHRVNRAYTVLTDEEKRRAFDSIYDCNDKIPSSSTEGDFFEVFGPVFARNARWSIATPVPSLGDANSTWEEVETFYDFWHSFESWRVFNHNDAHSESDIRCADRENRRNFVRANERARKKAKNEENARIGKLIDLAYKTDPRILAKKEREKKAKEEEEYKRGEAARAQKAREEAEAAAAVAKEEEAAKKKEAEANSARDAHKAKKQAEKKSRKRFRKAVATFELDPVKSDAMCTTVPPSELDLLVDAWEACADAGAAKTAFDEACTKYSI